MLAKQELQASLRKLLRREAGLREPKQFSPVRDWAIGVLGAVCLVGGVGVWSAQQYLENRDISSVVAETPAKVVYRSQLVDEVQRLYNNYEAERLKLITVVTTERVIIATTTASTSGAMVGSDIVSTSTDETGASTVVDGEFEMSF